MTPAKVKRIAEGGSAILCESSHSESGGHAGMIFFKHESGNKELLGETDPTFDTAEEAKASMEDMVKGIMASFKPKTARTTVEPDVPKSSSKKSKSGKEGKKNET